MNRKSRLVRIYLAILFCMIAERAIAQVNFEPPRLEGAIRLPPLGQCAGAAPSITSEKPVPPVSAPESAASSLLSLQWPEGFSCWRMHPAGNNESPR